MNKAAEIKCPHCGGILFVTFLDEQDGRWKRKVGSPQIEVDALGEFMNCPSARCGQRVDISQAGSGWTIPPKSQA